MLRECRRVLKQGGRLAVLVIETMPGLGEEQAAAATDLGPSAVEADDSLEEMARMAGFEVQHVEDVTNEFEATAASIWNAREASESELRAAEGDEDYETEQGKKARMLEGIRRGLLRRTLLIATKPTRPGAIVP